MKRKKLSDKKIYLNKGVLSDAIHFDQAGVKKLNPLEKFFSKINLRRIVYRSITLIIFSNFLILMGISNFLNFIFKGFEMLSLKIVMQFVRVRVSVDEQ
jgi:hypothetical protein